MKNLKNTRVQRVSLTIQDPSASNTRVDDNYYEVDLFADAKYLRGINIVSGVPGESLIGIRSNNMQIIEDLPVSAMQCDEDYVAPDERFFTAFPQNDEMKDSTLRVRVQPLGTPSGTPPYPYNMTLLLLIEV